MSIVVESPGLFDTIQDAGRPGHRSSGVPLGGWFDAESAAFANALAGNDRLSPCLEITLRSGLYRVLSPVRVGVAGPGAVITIDRETGHELRHSESIAADLEPGDRFRIHHPARGLRSYVAAAGGGWSGVSILGSLSSETRLAAGQVIEARTTHPKNSEPSTLRKLGFDLSEAADAPVELAFVPGDEFGALAGSTERFGQMVWKMSDRSDRVGVRFESSHTTPVGFEPIDPSRLSAPVVAGTIQWTGSQLIVLGVAGGTMGGYPLFGQLVLGEIARLAQRRPGSSVRFRGVSLDEAWTMSESKERKLRQNLMFVRLSERFRLPLTGEGVTNFSGVG